MWRTSCGERTLHGAEGRLFANALVTLLDEAEADQLYDHDFGLPCFDNLTYGQKIGVLSVVGNGLLGKDVPAAPLTAVLEGAITAVFAHLKNSVTFEIEESEMGTLWRQMIVAARKEMKAEEIPEPTCRDLDEWDIEIHELSDCILWDADCECEDLFVDRPPEEAKELKRETGVSEDYFAAIADDLTEEQVGHKIAQLRRLCREIIAE
jgi:hypothetical protein